ncbi:MULTISPECIES: hypothetical protein [Brucella]|uniref:hypothetical protein n=1 Tax=Brucella TaxID=234 RepID=UPI001FE6B8AE|nr:hypothetical protein [Brucella intermedia]WGG60741.1 hypothetical protein QA414_03630 [Brucella intermedia]
MLHGKRCGLPADLRKQFDVVEKNSFGAATPIKIVINRQQTMGRIIHMRQTAPRCALERFDLIEQIGASQQLVF